MRLPEPFPYLLQGRDQRSQPARQSPGCTVALFGMWGCLRLSSDKVGPLSLVHPFQAERKVDWEASLTPLWAQGLNIAGFCPPQSQSSLPLPQSLSLFPQFSSCHVLKDLGPTAVCSLPASLYKSRPFARQLF